jgi:hypothetical protein
MRGAGDVGGCVVRPSGALTTGFKGHGVDRQPVRLGPLWAFVLRVRHTLLRSLNLQLPHRFGSKKKWETPNFVVYYHN